MNVLSQIRNGLVKENPIFRLVLGMCPTLAVTTSLEKALGMGIATTFVLICSNIVISLVRISWAARLRRIERRNIEGGCPTIAFIFW